MPPDTMWVRTYGGTNNDIGYSICVCSDGGYLAAGYTSSLGSGPQSAYIVRIDQSGDTIWTRAYGGSSWDGAHYVYATADTCYLIAGYTESYGSGGKDMYLLKLDHNGDTIWTRTYGGTLQDCAYVICDAHDGGYLAVGYRNGPSGWTKGDLWLLKLDDNGDTLWTKTYGGTGEDYGISLRHTLDGNYIISGVNTHQSAGGKDAWLLKVDTAGDTIWSRVYGGTLEDVGYGVNCTSDSGYIMTGYINGTGSWTAGDLWLIKTDANGDSIWTRVYGSNDEDFGFEVYETSDQGFIIAGETGFGAGLIDVWLVRTDENGDTAWTQTYGGYARDASLGLCMDTDGGYVLVGHTRSSGSGYADVFVIKTYPDLGIETQQGMIIRPAMHGATIVSGSIPPPVDQNCDIYDITGKQIHTLSPAPGIYFIVHHNEPAQKIVLVK
jgi:hypothetical protein